MKYRPQDNQKWPEIAPGANRSTWRKEYNRLFRENLKRQDSWREAQKTKNINMNASQTEALKYVESLISGPSRVLDVGCGPGFLTMALLTKGHDAYGCDVSDEAIQYCKGVVPDWANRFFVKEAEDLESLAKETPFDVVICNQVLEHLKEPEKVIRILWSLVKEGGHLVIGVPRGREFDIAYHLHFYDEEKDFAKLLKTVATDYPSGYKTYQINETNVFFFLGHIRKEPLLLRYALICGTDAEVYAANDIIMDRSRIKTGLFNWARMFDGMAYTIDAAGDLNDYDIVHVQMSGTNFSVPSVVRDRLGPHSDTKLIVTLDYAMEYWYMYPPFPDMILRNVQVADLITAVEPHSATLLSDLLNDREIHIIPHPTDVERIIACSRPKEARDGGAMVMIHRDNEDSLPYWMLRGLGLKTSLYGRIAPLGSPTGQQVDYPALYYNQVMQGYMGNQSLVRDVMSRAFLAVDSYTHHVCGRTAIEFAALGVPCIGYRNVWAQDHCFPELTVDTGRADQGRELARRLINDDAFYAEVATHAQSQARYFGWNIARERFLRMLEDNHVHFRSSAPPLGKKIEEVRPAADPEVEQSPEPVGGSATAVAAG